MQLEKLEIAIAGAGIGGLALATLVARQGARVVVYDQMDQPKPVGSGFVLQPTGAAILECMGLLIPIREHGRLIDRMIGKLARSGKTVLDVRYRNGGCGIAVQRPLLFDVLFDAATKAGVQFEAFSRVRDVHSGARPHFILESGASTAAADLAVDATGANSAIGGGTDGALEYGALWATVPWNHRGVFRENLLEQRYEKASRMAGILPVGRIRADATDMATFFWSLRSADYPHWLERGRGAWLAEIEHLWPEALDIAAQAEPVFAKYRHRTSAPVTGRNSLKIGDAWHATSPQLGQGANMALLDAASLATALLRGASIDDALRRHLHLRRLHVATYQTLSRLLTPLYQSDSRLLPVLRDWTIAPASGLPGIRDIISTIVTGDLLDPVGRVGLVPPLWSTQV